MFEKLNRNFDNENLGDVGTGKVYKFLKKKGVIGINDITLQWNIDGLTPFKSSQVSISPIQFAIDELPYKIRKKWVMICGLWHGKTKPKVELYFEPFTEELRDLHENGFDLLVPNIDEPTVINIKVHTFLAPVDTIARWPCQNIHQFNGK